MKLLLDQGRPRSAVERLAAGEKAAVDTLDADFHAILARSGASGPSVIRLRIEGLRADVAATIIQHVLVRWADAIRSGAMISVRTTPAAVRRLPIRSRI